MISYVIYVCVYIYIYSSSSSSSSSYYYYYYYSSSERQDIKGGYSYGVGRTVLNRSASV